VGMGVFFGGPAMRGPAGVADAECAFEGVLAENFFKIGELAGGAADIERGAGRAADGDSRGIIATVFEATQSLNDDGNYFLFADITDDSAHTRILCDEANGAPATKRLLCLQRKSYGYLPFCELKSAMIAARGLDRWCASSFMAARSSFQEKVCGAPRAHRWSGSQRLVSTDQGTEALSFFVESALAKKS
jgi:hypothetical protein